MAGHSKFKNIQFRKGAQDKKRSKVFSKLAREITAAAKMGLPDPAMNARLRGAIQTARAQNRREQPANEPTPHATCSIGHTLSVSCFDRLTCATSPDGSKKQDTPYQMACALCLRSRARSSAATTRSRKTRSR